MAFKLNRLVVQTSFIALAAALASPAVAEEDAVDVSEIVVTAQRTTAQITPPTHQITRLDREEIEDGRAASDTLSTILAKAVPGLANSAAR